jgi:hypothetical protein
MLDDLIRSKHVIEVMFILNKKFWEELISHFSLIRHGLHRKRRVQQCVNSYTFFLWSGNVFM